MTVLAVSTAALAGGKKAPPRKGGAKEPSVRLEVDDLPGPQPEIARDPIKVELPQIPAFDLPAVEPGFHAPRELRVRGRPVLGTEIQVKGYVTSIYDCPAALAATHPGATRAQILASIDRDTSLCERPNLYLGDARDAPRDASIWVVDVPRAPTQTERARASKDELKAWPAVPRIAVGDYVVVTGTWALYSPHGQRSIDGLLVYQALERATPGAASATSSAQAASEPDIAVVTKPPLRKLVSDAVFNASAGHLNACNKAIAARQYDAGMAECEAAIKGWDGNHLAWYTWASAHMAKNEWPQARDAVEHAVTLRPDQAMYQLYYGISLYEAEQERVRKEMAQRDNKKPEEVTVEPGLLKLDGARDALRRAVKLGPALWRAHYYLGRVYRDLDDAGHAAEQFAQTIATHPSYRFGYIALIELYRKWGYFDEALAIAKLGTTRVPAAETGELWFELGTAYEGKHDPASAIEAFTKAIASKPGDLSSKFQRGQIYFRKGDYANAQRDLEEVARSTDPALASIRPLAAQMLGQISGKRR